MGYEMNGIKNKNIKRTRDNKYYINNYVGGKYDINKGLIFKEVKGEPIEKYVKNKQLLEIIKNCDVFVSHNRGIGSMSESITGCCLWRIFPMNSIENVLFELFRFKSRRNFLKNRNIIINRHKQVTPRWEIIEKAK